jgi:hypothetical protein
MRLFIIWFPLKYFGPFTYRVRRLAHNVQMRLYLCVYSKINKGPSALSGTASTDPGAIRPFRHCEYGPRDHPPFQALRVRTPHMLPIMSLNSIKSTNFESINSLNVTKYYVFFLRRCFCHRAIFKIKVSVFARFIRNTMFRIYLHICLECILYDYN